MKQTWIKITGIGIFHSVLYLYIVPFVIYPEFGRTGLVAVAIASVVISIAVLGTGLCKSTKKKKSP